MGIIPLMKENDWRKRLRDLMAARSLTMKDLSLAAGQGATYVRDVLERQRSPSIDNFVAMANALNVDPGSLLTGRPAPESRPDPEAQLRAALLAYGVDHVYLDVALLAIKGFAVDDPDDERPGSDLFPADTGPASRRRESEPSR